MSTIPDSAIARLVEHHGGPAKVAKLLDNNPPYQRLQEWVGRGWASPLQFLRLEPLLPEGLTIRDLYADIVAVKSRKASTS
jgi:hypothetical protein